MIEINRDIVEAIKLSVRRLELLQISVPVTLRKSIEYLYDDYLHFNNPKYLNAAIAQIQAYLELGFCYEDHQGLFDKVLDTLGTTKQIQFPKRTYCATKLLLTRSQIRKAIKTWSGSKYHTMSINELTDDIIRKVREQKPGRYEYHSNANPRGRGTDYVYELLIEEDESYLYDVWNNLYYSFVLDNQRKTHEDCDC